MTVEVQVLSAALLKALNCLVKCFFVFKNFGSLSIGKDEEIFEN